MITPDRPLLLAGCGKMGEALVGGWLESGFSPECFVVSDPAAERLGRAHAMRGVRLYMPEQLPPLSPSVLFLAIKPQQFSDALQQLRPYIAKDTLVVSIAAGKGLDSIAAGLGDQIAAIRAMPNTPALIGKGVTVACPNAHVTAMQHDIANALLSAIGNLFWVEHETLLDPVTALSGSGPAYVFLFTEWLVNAGVHAGLPESLAQELALLTVSGSAELAYQSLESLSQLRKNVTSPGGTTEAALAILQRDDALQQRFTDALLAATQRAAALRKI